FYSFPGPPSAGSVRSLRLLMLSRKKQCERRRATTLSLAWWLSLFTDGRQVYGRTNRSFNPRTVGLFNFAQRKLIALHAVRTGSERHDVEHRAHDHQILLEIDELHRLLGLRRRPEVVKDQCDGNEPE